MTQLLTAWFVCSWAAGKYRCPELGGSSEIRRHTYVYVMISILMIDLLCACDLLTYAVVHNVRKC